MISLGGRGSTCDRRLPASALAGPSDAERCLGKGGEVPASVSMECCGGDAGGQSREGDGGEDGLIAIYTLRHVGC